MLGTPQVKSFIVDDDNISVNESVTSPIVSYRALVTPLARRSSR